MTQTVDACPACQARITTNAAWCGQCYHPLGDAAPDPTPAQPVAAAPPQPGPADPPPAPPAPPVHAAPPVQSPPAAPAYQPDSRFLWSGGPTTPTPAAPPAPIAPPQAIRAGYAESYAPPAPPAAPGPPPGMLMRPGAWAPPAPTAPPMEPSRTGTLGSWGSGSTGYTVVAMILLGGLLQLVFFLIARKGTIEPEAFIRYSIVGTVTFYGIVAVVVTSRLNAGRVHLFWSDGNKPLGIAIGAGVGLGLGLGLLALNSLINGHLTTDPGITMLVSEGDVAHIAAAVLLTMIAAPIVEEILFRGLFAESMRSKGTATAVWLSAIAFAAWHWQPAQLRYYSLMGALFAALYLKRGLVCTMTMHACFNGVLTVTAIFIALAPGHVVHGPGYDITVPRGWHTDTSGAVPGDGVYAVGPSGAELLVFKQPVGTNQMNTDRLLTMLTSGQLSSFMPGVEVDAANTHEVDLPIGTGVEASIEMSGHHGELVFIPDGADLLFIVFGSGGSVQAVQDFHKMLPTIHKNLLGPGTPTYG